MKSFIPDPDDPSIPYSQQRKYLLDVLEAGLKVIDPGATARVQLDLYCIEVWDASRAYPDVANPFMLGKPGQGDV